jgi:hypothetical protein
MELGNRRAGFSTKHVSIKRLTNAKETNSHQADLYYVSKTTIRLFSLCVSFCLLFQIMNTESRSSIGTMTIAASK